MWNRQKIQEKVKESADKYGYGNSQQLKQLIFSCKKSNDAEVFFGLFSFFYDPNLQENSEVRQELAGKILIETCPTCPLNIDGAIYAAPGAWDVSVEELPWYFCASFGKSRVQDFLNELIPEISDSLLKEKYETMLFWVKAYGQQVT